MIDKINMSFGVRIYPTRLFSQDGSEGFVCSSNRYNIKGYGKTRQFAKFDFIRNLKEALSLVSKDLVNSITDKYKTI